MAEPSAAPRHRSRWLPTLLVACLVVLTAEAGARVLDRHLVEPQVWADQATAVKVAQLAELARERGCVDVIFAGSSMARDALVPPTFTEADPSGRHAYNAALDAASPALVRRWLTEQVLTRVDTSTVVLGLASFDLSDAARAPASALEAYESATYSAPGWANHLQARIVRHSALVRHQQALRDPGEVAAALGRLVRREDAARAGAEGIEGVIARDGHGLSRAELTYRPDGPGTAFVAGQLLNDFSVGPRSVAALRRLVRDLQARDVQVALLILPVTDEYVDLHPDGADDMAGFEAALVSIGEDLDVPVLSRPVLDPTDFADTHHVNRDGAAKVSGALPAMLDEAGVPVRHCPGATPPQD